MALGKIGDYKGGTNPSQYIDKTCNCSIGFDRNKNLPETVYETFKNCKVPSKSGRVADNAYIVY